MAEDNEDNKEYRWETGYEKTWEALEEDEDGLIESSIADIIEKSKRKRHADKIGVRLGMMRHMNVILDCSDAMLDQDLKPTRHLCTLKLFEGFIEEFFEQNPISQLGIIVTRNKRAERLTDLSGNYRKHIETLKSSCSDPNYCVGEPSLQNSLELAYSTMRMLPTHTSREILVIMGSLTVCDPGDINVIIQQLSTAGIRCSVIGLAAEVCVYKLLARVTRGSYAVVLDDRHFRDLLSGQVEPIPMPDSVEASLVKMGFPHHLSHGGKEAPFTTCMCHLEDGSTGGSAANNNNTTNKTNTPSPSKLNKLGYFCPQCRSKYCELPVECRTCGLTLATSLHLARSLHHLAPVKPFLALEVKSCLSSLPRKHCFACQKSFSQEKNVYKCGSCQVIYCLDCDLFIHDILHSCPGCSIRPKSLSATQPPTSLHHNHTNGGGDYGKKFKV
ncbi:hypothetical protein M8J76_015108 [Diaphorina citri]|nr:hypothetical protein M8J75_003343 [Diaphorina citri]KAI5745873.1 hypothetical protein M8J76_015108 [Diaphorina citri]KAI5752500.1 hypothetical protein M8J77_017540 [Diaphorina citri]